MELSLSQMVRYPNEIRAMFKIKARHKEYKPEKASLDRLAKQLDDLEFCYAVLGKVSRSFSVVIQQLPCELKDSVCIFYLVLRGLDSIEDDTEVSFNERKDLLLNFHKHHFTPGWKITGVGDSKDYKLLLENYDKVIAAFSSLDKKYQSIIIDICKEMGEGMSKYLDKTPKTTEEYNEYCYYVAGLVGIGLSRLFSSSGVESNEVAELEHLSNSMGLFLQKTNIIRDYYEDILAKRTFWPKDIWSIYTEELEGLANSNESKAVHCLNHLITNALFHASDSLRYLKNIKNPLVFKFCAIPQVMAIATLNEIYGNADVFRKNVKIRKGLAAKLILEASDYDSVLQIFKEFSKEIFNKISLDDPNCFKTVEALNTIFADKRNTLKEAPIRKAS